MTDTLTKTADYAVWNGQSGTRLAGLEGRQPFDPRR